MYPTVNTVMITKKKNFHPRFQVCLTFSSSLFYMLMRVLGSDDSLQFNLSLRIYPLYELKIPIPPFAPNKVVQEYMCPSHYFLDRFSICQSAVYAYYFPCRSIKWFV